MEEFDYPADLYRLTPESRNVAEAVVGKYPAWAQRMHLVKVEGADLCEFSFHVPSPASDEHIFLEVFFAEGELSFGLGREWHTHLGYEDEGIATLLDYIEATLADEFVVTVQEGGEFDGAIEVFDIRDNPKHWNVAVIAEQVPETKLRLRTWSGGKNRVVFPWIALVEVEASKPNEHLSDSECGLANVIGWGATESEFKDAIGRGMSSEGLRVTAIEDAEPLSERLSRGEMTDYVRNLLQYVAKNYSPVFSHLHVAPKDS